MDEVSGFPMRVLYRVVNHPLHRNEPIAGLIDHRPVVRMPCYGFVTTMSWFMQILTSYPYIR